MVTKCPDQTRCRKVIPQTFKDFIPIIYPYYDSKLNHTDRRRRSGIIIYGNVECARCHGITHMSLTRSQSTLLNFECLDKQVDTGKVDDAYFFAKCLIQLDLEYLFF